MIAGLLSGVWLFIKNHLKYELPARKKGSRT